VNPIILKLGFKDIDEFAEEVPALDIEPIQLSRGQLQVDLVSVNFGDIAISELSCNQQVADRIYIDPDWLLVVFQFSPQRWNSCESPPNSLTLIRPDSSCRTLVFEGFHCVEVAIRVELAHEIGLSRWTKLSRVPTVISLPRHTLNVAMRWFGSLLTNLNSDGLLGFDHGGAATRERCLEFICWLKESIQPSRGRLNMFHHSHSLKRFDLVEAALQIIDVSEIDHPLSVTDLARILCVSRRTLLSAFLDVLGIPPSRYLLARKLHFARQALNSGTSTTVTDAAFSHGFEHLSHFSSHYADLFGELPSTTLQRSNKICRLILAGNRNPVLETP
jgi:AraC-like DNA-binding protein